MDGNSDYTDWHHRVNHPSLRRVRTTTAPADVDRSSGSRTSRPGPYPYLENEAGPQTARLIDYGTRTDQMGSNFPSRSYSGGEGHTSSHDVTAPQHSYSNSHGFTPLYNFQEQHQYLQHGHAANATSSSSTPSITEDQATDRYVPQPEYALLVAPCFSYTSEDQAIFRELSEDQRLVIFQRLHQVVPYTSRYLRTRLLEHLKPAEALDLLSGDEERIDAAINRLYRSGVFRREDITWMHYLEKQQRIEVVAKVAEATQRDAEKVRDHFLQKNVPPHVLQEILGTSSLKEIKKVAKRNDLLIEDDTKVNAWQKGTSVIQRKAILQRMTRSRPEVHQSKLHDWLRKKKVPKGYGLVMLRASTANFERIMSALSTRGELPTL
ncbi:hypothetical protein CBS101457_000166 [Exobasidium rhododendri]|nr:hypothetical protein CBS101457_000166 [Exobasidium rhododendri]